MINFMSCVFYHSKGEKEKGGSFFFFKEALFSIKTWRITSNKRTLYK